ncbi:hypothetical protein GCM10009552_11780 [Rothia nasimurium]
MIGLVAREARSYRKDFGAVRGGFGLVAREARSYRKDFGAVRDGFGLVAREARSYGSGFGRCGMALGWLRAGALLQGGLCRSAPCARPVSAFPQQCHRRGT